MFDFPSAPSNGQQVTAPNGAVYAWNGTSWAPVSIGLPAYAPLASPVFTGDARAVTPAVGDADTSIATTAFVQSAVAPVANNTGRNLVMNGAFAVAQRGVGNWTASGYTVDRWFAVVATDTASFSQVALLGADRTAIGDEAAEFALQDVFTGSAAAGAIHFIQQPIENLSRLAGKVVTISFWAKAASGTPKIGINVYRNYGTGGSPSAAEWLFPTGQAVTIGTTWARYTATFSIPTAVGKALGTNRDHFTEPSLFYSSGATNNALTGNIGVQSGTIQLWGIQLEVGTQATPFDAGGTPADQLRQCQRFFETSYPPGQAPGTAGGGPSLFVVTGLASAANITTQTVQFAVAKRAAPTMNYFSPQTGAAGKVRDYQANADVNASSIAVNTNAFAWNATAGAAATIMNMGVCWTASADL